MATTAFAVGSIRSYRRSPMLHPHSAFDFGGRLRSWLRRSRSRRQTLRVCLARNVAAGTTGDAATKYARLGAAGCCTGRVASVVDTATARASPPGISAAASVRQCGGFGLRPSFVILGSPGQVISSRPPTRRSSSATGARPRSASNIYSIVLLLHWVATQARSCVRRAEAKATSIPHSYTGRLRIVKLALPCENADRSVDAGGVLATQPFDRRVLRSDPWPSSREQGVAGTTVNAVARRAGVARSSIYPRYSSRDRLITAAIRAAIGREPNPGHRRPRAGHPPHR